MAERVPMEEYARAADEARFFDAATDATLWARWKERKDPLARALLIVAAAHLHATRGNAEGARAKLDRVPAYLSQAPGEPLAKWLGEHVDAASRAVAQGEPLPRLCMRDAPH